MCNLRQRISVVFSSQKYVKVKCALYRHWGSVQAVRPIGEVEVQLYPLMTTALEGGEGSASGPGRFLPPGKTRYPLYRRLSGPPGRCGQVREISPSPGFDPRTVQPVASRYTYWAMPAHQTHVGSIKSSKNKINLLVLQGLFESLNHADISQAQHGTPAVLLQHVQLHFILCMLSQLRTLGSNRRENLALWIYEACNIEISLTT
jgi:hypothetical protein